MQAVYIKIYHNLEKDHWWWQTRREIIIKKLQLLNFQKKPKLLDIGCGAGVVLKKIRTNFHCVGVEPDPKLGQFAQKNSQVKIFHGSLPDKIPAFKNQFDIILLLDVLEHVKQDKQALIEIKKLLKKDGYLIINVPAMAWLWSEHDRVNQHFRRYEKKDLQNLLQQSGFNIISLKYWGFSLAILAYLNRNFKQDHYQVKIPNLLINTLLRIYAKVEYWLTSKITLPWGLSILAVAQKN